MLAFQWLNRFVTHCRAQKILRLLDGDLAGRSATTTGASRPQKERRLRLMRLEQRRVLNADFTFVAHSNLAMSHVDGDLAVHEVANHIEFDLTGSAWNHVGGNGLFTIDNSVANHSVLSIDRSDFSGLNAGVSISADPNGAHHLTLETQNAAVDLQIAAGPLAIRDFADVHQVGLHDLLVNDFSVTARGSIELQHLRGDDLTLSAVEIDFNGGSHSIAGNSLTVLSGSTSSIEIGGGGDHANVLDFTSADLGALAGGFQSISFSAHSGQLSGDHSGGSITVLSSGADVRDALLPTGQGSETQIGSLQLSADIIHIDGELTNAGGLIDVSATHAVTISHSGGLVSHGGEIVVDAGLSGTLLDLGHVDVSSVDPHGVSSDGSIHLLGEQVGLFGGARVDASGDSGGGEVLIGGDLHGGNEAIHHALRTYVGSDVEINADAIQHGNGGKVVVWSDEVSQVYGSLTARGGALSGDGGLIETSSRGQLLLNGGGDASSANGQAGTWLLDPLNVGIVQQLTLFPTIIEFNELPDFAPSVSGSEVTADAIAMQLSIGTDVVITTENLNYSEVGNVTQAANATIDVTFIAGGDTATLTINAANDIVLNGGITAANGALSVVLNSNAITNNDDLDLVSGNVMINAAIDLNGGSFASTGIDFNSIGGAITAAGGVTITHTGLVDLGQIDTGTGTGGTLLLNGATAHDVIAVGEGDIAINGANTDTVIMADVSATDSVIISATQDVIVQSTITVTGPTSDLTITADSNSDGVGGFWLDEGSSVADAQLIASHNITIIGSSLVATAATNDGVRIDGDGTNQQVVAGNDLTLLSNFDAASTTGDIVIDGVQVATSGSLTVFANDQIFLGADQTAGNDLLFKSAVQLTNDVAVTAGDDVTFDSTVDDDGSNATGSALTVTSASPGAGVLFVGAVGADGGDRLDSLNVNGAGFVDFLSTVAIDGDINVSTTSSVDIVTFQNAVSTTTGLGGAVTGTVTITNAGLLVTSKLATFDLAGSFTQNGAGSTELGADITTADGDVSFAQAVLLTDSVKIDTGSNDHNITFSSTIDSEVVPLALLDGNLVPVSQVGGDIADVVAVNAEHNSLVLTAGAGVIRFDGDIGAGYIDVNAGMDGDQTLGSLTVNSADSVLIGPVETIAIDRGIDIGHDSVITNGIHIDGIGDPYATTIRSDHADIRINGQVTEEVDLVINAANGIVLTDAAGIQTHDHNITINGDTDINNVGDLLMGPNTLIDAGAGDIDLRANNIVLGALLSTNANPTDADHPAIRVEATTGSITDGGDVRTDITASTPGSGVVLLAVKGIGSDLTSSGSGSDNALETDIVSLVAYNHDIDPLNPATAADGNIQIHDIGTEASHRVDLIFVHNEANQTAQQFADASQDFQGTFAPPSPGSLVPPPVDVQFEFFAVTPGLPSNDIVIHFTSSPHAGVLTGVPTIAVTGHTIDIDLDSNGTAANILRDAINSNEQAKALIQARITSPAATVESNIAARAVGTSVNLSGAGVQVGVIDVSVDSGDLRVVTDPSRPLLFELLQPGPPSSDSANPALITADDPPFANADQVVPAIQAENTIRFTAQNIEVFDDILAIQDANSVGNHVNEFIEINARGNFTLGADRVVSTDENYAGSLVVGAPQKDMVHNVTPGQDAIRITADFDRNSADFSQDGTVLLGSNSTISTDVGIEQQISPRPVREPLPDSKEFVYSANSAFFSGKIIVSNLESIEVGSKDPVYLGSLTFTIGVPGERNLVLDIDWGDGVSAPFKNNGSAPVLRSGGFVFEPTDSNKFATRFLIPEGGLTYTIPHQYTQDALNLKNNDGKDIPQPGRTLTSDALQVRFSVSQHESISVEGRSVFNPDSDGTDTPDIPKNSPYNVPPSPLDDKPTVLNGETHQAVPATLHHDGLFALSSTNVTDNPTAFLPRFDNGQAAFVIPTHKAVSFFVPADSAIVPFETPRLVTSETVVIAPALLTTETTVISSSSSSVTTTEYFELRRFNDDGTIEIERLNDFQGDGLLDKERFEKFISDKGDGEYEIWFITRENSSGTMIERPVIHFRLEGGHLAPPPNDSPLLFKPFRLIPVPVVPKPANDAGDAADKPDGAAANDGQQPKIDIADDQMPDGKQSGKQSSDSGNLSAMSEIVDGLRVTEFANLNAAVHATEQFEASSSPAASLVAGVLVFAGTRRWRRRTTDISSPSFSRSARLARQLVMHSQDQ